MDKMLFPFRKTFSLVNLHRRARSETDERLCNVPNVLIRTTSLSGIDAANMASPSKIPCLQTISEGSDNLPDAFCGAPRSVAAHCTVETLERRVHVLASENENLKERVSLLEIEIRLSADELSRFKDDYYGERFQANIRNRLSKAAEDRAQDQSRKLEQVDRFITAIVDLGLHNATLSGAWQAVKAGSNSDDALVAAIRQAAAIPTSSWSKILQEASKTQAPEWHSAEACATIEPPTDLPETTPEKSVRLPCRTGTVSLPEPTEGPDPHDTLIPKKTRAVDNLLENLRAGVTPGERKADLNPSAGVTPYGSRKFGVSGTRQPDAVVTLIPGVPYPSAIPKASVARPSQLHPRSCVPRPQLLLSGGNDENVGRGRCIKRHHKFGQMIQSWPAVMDSNRCIQDNWILLNTTNVQVNGQKERNPDKRNAMIFPKAKQSATTLGDAHGTSAHGMPSDNPVNTTSHGTGIDSTKETVMPSKKRDSYPTIERALQSLEQICAAFSSGSLGSLGTTTEGSEAGIQKPTAKDRSHTLNDAVSVPAPRRGALNHISNSQCSQRHLTPFTPKTEKLIDRTVIPVHKKSGSTPKSSHNPDSPSISRPTASSALKSLTTPKRLVGKDISPLRIRKKTQLPTVKQATSPPRFSCGRTAISSKDHLKPASGNKENKLLSRNLVRRYRQSDGSGAMPKDN